MKTLSMPKKDRALGISEKHTYDIPLDRGTGRLFLTSLIGLMVFLALISVAAAFILTSFANQWQSGLEGKWTIEIPAIDANGELIPRDELQDMAQNIINITQGFAAITESRRLANDEILNLIAPWFDGQADSENLGDIDLPIPALITLTMRDTKTTTANDILNAIQEITPLARLDRHEEWLEQLLRLTGMLRFTALIFTALICVAGVVAIAGAMQSRLAEHRESIELLHLMGASDGYIAKQFQRHAIIIAAKGAMIGFVCTLCFMFLINLYLSGQNNLLPVFTGGYAFWLLLLVVPVITVGLCLATARVTVLHTLRQML